MIYNQKIYQHAELDILVHIFSEQVKNLPTAYL